MINALMEIVGDLRQTALNCLERAEHPEIKGTMGARTLRIRAEDSQLLADRLEMLILGEEETA